MVTIQGDTKADDENLEMEAQLEGNLFPCSENI